jgi:hypothetical protein
MSEQVTNAFGQTVSAPKLAWKPIAQMDAQERREYNRLRAADSRKKRKEKEDLIDEKKRLEEQQASLDGYQERQLQRSIKPTPENWNDEISKLFDPLLNQMILELDRPGPWLYKKDYFIVRPLADLVFGIPRKFITIDSAGCRAGSGLFPDAVMLAAIEYDKKILNRSKTFRDFYADALRQTISLIQDPKFKPFIEWTGTIRNAFEETINIDFVPTGN